MHPSSQHKRQRRFHERLLCWYMVRQPQPSHQTCIKLNQTASAVFLITKWIHRVVVIVTSPLAVLLLKVTYEPQFFAAVCQLSRLNHSDALFMPCSCSHLSHSFLIGWASCVFTKRAFWFCWFVTCALWLMFLLLHLVLLHQCQYY